MASTYLVILVIVCGWGVGLCVTLWAQRRNRKLTQRINWVNEKNDLLAKVVEDSMIAWHRKPGDDLNITKIESSIVINIKKVRDIYADLGKIDKKKFDVSHKLQSLKRLATLDIEECQEIDDDELDKTKLKLIKIYNIVDDLKKIPEQNL